MCSSDLIDEEYSSCIDQLREILEASKPGSSPFAELNKLYMQILSIYPDTDLLLRVLGSLLAPILSRILFNDQGVGGISTSHPGQVEHILRRLHSVFLSITPYESSHLMPPFFNFFSTRAGQEDYYINQENITADIIRGTADLMRDYDKRESSLG